MHTSINITEEVIKVIKDFSISDQLGYFMLNNILNNNTAIKAITEAFRFNPIKYSFCCLSYIINLIIYYLLFRFNLYLFKIEEILPKDLKVQLKK